MSDSPITVDVRDFILEYIDSVAQLEALLILRSSPQQTWDIPTVARRLFIVEAEAAQILSGLVASELATTDGTTFSYCIRDTGRRELVDKVAQSYSQFLVPVTKLIHAKSVGIRKFASAFKFRRDD